MILERLVVIERCHSGALAWQQCLKIPFSLPKNWGALGNVEGFIRKISWLRRIALVGSRDVPNKQSSTSHGMNELNVFDCRIWYGLNGLSGPLLTGGRGQAVC